VCRQLFSIVEHSHVDGSTELFGIFGSHVHLDGGVLIELRVITELASLAMGDVKTQIGHGFLNQGSRLEDFQFVVEEAGEIDVVFKIFGEGRCLRQGKFLPFSQAETCGLFICDYSIFENE
jgi:hypothetical protein